MGDCENVAIFFGGVCGVCGGECGGGGGGMEFFGGGWGWMWRDGLHQENQKNT